MIKAVYVRCRGDWEGIYVDGELYKEDHSLPPRAYLNVSRDYDIDDYEVVRGVDLQGDYDRASLPESLDELDEDI